MQLTDGSGCEVEQIQSGIEQFVEQAHEAQHGTVRVINMHDWILVHIDELMRRFALQNRPEIVERVSKLNR